MKILILQHIACESPGTYMEVMNDRGVETTVVQLDEGGSIPDWRAFGAVVCMGGPMNVGDDQQLPWLSAERSLIADAVRSGLPFWGVCLGSQLLARSLGAKVYRSATPEVGMGDISLTQEGRRDAVMGILPRRFRTLQWHEDTFDIPKGGVLLGSSVSCRNQAFRFGQHAYGLQFHLEVSAEMCARWAEVPAYRQALRARFGPDGVRKLTDEVSLAAPGMRDHALRLFSTWLSFVANESDRARRRILPLASLARSDASTKADIA
jgi:GMP synthase-like glutamine amidotransferase